MTATLYVCHTCRIAGQDCGDEARPGALLHHALLAEPLPKGVTIRAVECLSACSQGCSVALSALGKWTYVYGRMSEVDAAAILDGAARYAASNDGVVPWRERPEIFRKQSLARIPPQAPPNRSEP
jgi:predicted metal-binding protein